jgi:hypothetical protein
MKVRIVYYLIAGFYLLFNGSCSIIIISPDNEKDILFYFNSFEKPDDLRGWEGDAYRVVEGDVPPQGRKKALEVSGGCIIPHASFLFQPEPVNRRFILHAWGKWLHGSGGISLESEPNPISSYRPYIGMSIDRPEWTFYESKDTLTVPANIPFRLSVLAGGLVPGAVMVDRISIIRIME